MFYSHESMHCPHAPDFRHSRLTSSPVLTSRKYGVATVWVVATLGSRSNLKKVSRKAILDVNVTKACETIVTPEAPMALRLQSNLLYGVARVYAQQCGYVLNDVETARNNMRALFSAVQAAELEPEGVHQARAEQLVLQSDPNFLLDLDLAPTDINELLRAAPAAVDSQQSILSPKASQTVSSSSQGIGGLWIPPSHSPSVAKSTGRPGSMRLPEDSEAGVRLESGRLLEDDFGLVIDPDGTVRLSDLTPSRPFPSLGTAVEASLLTKPQERRESREVLSNLEGTLEDIAGREENVVPPSDPADLDFVQQAEVLEQQKSTSESAQASIRPKKRVLKPIPLDNSTQLHNSDLSSWSANYLSNMRDMMQAKETSKVGVLARKNAEFWVLGPMRELGANMPLAIFTGARLLEAFTGVQLFPGGKKRSRDEEEDERSEHEGRRVRSREDPLEAEMGRVAQENTDQDNDLIAAMDDNEVELGRNAPTPLDDRLLSSIFPWNQSATSRGRSNVPSSGSFAAAGPQLSMISRRGSRMVSASPLLGRSTLGWQDTEEVYFPEAGIPSTDDGDFELFGLDAGADTQIDLQSPWQRAAVNGETTNFLNFVKNAISDANLIHQQLDPAEEAAVDLTDSIEFETLLPPESNSVVVAAQAMVNVLVLGTEGLLDVQQEEIFGPISLRIQDNG